MFRRRRSRTQTLLPLARSRSTILLGALAGGLAAAIALLRRRRSADVYGATPEGTGPATRGPADPSTAAGGESGDAGSRQDSGEVKVFFTDEPDLPDREEAKPISEVEVPQPGAGGDANGR